MEEKLFGPVRFIPGDNRGKYPFCHSIYVEGAGVLVDPASSRERLLDLKKEGRVASVWLSHCHEDHFMHLDLFDDRPLFIAEADAPPLSDLEILMDYYGMEENLRDYWRPFFIDQFHFRPRKPSAFLKDGDVVDLGGVSVDIIGTPGHTPGHLAFFFREVEVLFLGDYDLSAFGPWYGDVHSSIEETIRSVKRLKEFPARVWLTSHEKGLFEEEPGEKWDHYLEVIEARESRLLAFLQKPRTMEEIVKACIIYGKPREPRIFYEFGERVHMEKHLDRLMGQGVVAVEDNKYFRP